MKYNRIFILLIIILSNNSIKAQVELEKQFVTDLTINVSPIAPITFIGDTVHLKVMIENRSIEAFILPERYLVFIWRELSKPMFAENAMRIRDFDIQTPIVRILPGGIYTCNIETILDESFTVLGENTFFLHFIINNDTVNKYIISKPYVLIIKQ